MNEVTSLPVAAPPDGLSRALAWLSAMPVALIVLLTFADVFGRYVFASPLRGSVEIIEYAMAMVIFSALPLVTRQRGHISVSLIDNMVKGAAERWKVLLCDSISVIALGLLTWRLWVKGLDDLKSKAATVVLKMPHAPLSFVLSVLAGLTAVLMLVLLWRTFTQASTPLGEGA